LSAASSVAFHVPAPHAAHVPEAEADPDPAAHDDILNAIMLLMKKRVCVFIEFILKFNN
jgi:hypothetical protein